LFCYFPDGGAAWRIFHWEELRSERDDKAQEKIDRDLGRTFKCPKKNCSSSFKNINGLRKHKSAIHAPPIKCTFRGCLKMVKKTNMGQHLETHKNEPKMCKDCGLDFTSWKNSLLKIIQKNVQRIVVFW
jgi:hypothetical protein